MKHSVRQDHWMLSLYQDISNEEREYLILGCEEGIRADGRALSDFREIKSEDNILPHTNGSSRVRMGSTVDIVCSIKADISTPLADKPNDGIVKVWVDFSKACNNKLDDRQLNEISVHASSILQNILVESAAINLNELSILSGKYCWLINIDVLVQAIDGDVIDVSSLAIFVALRCTKIPKVELVIGESGRFEDFEISGDLFDAVSLPLVDPPICITAAKIGEVIVYDCTADELVSADVALVVGVDGSGNCCGIHKLFSGHISESEIIEIFDTAVDIARAILPELSNVGLRQAELDSRYPDRPPLRMGLLN